MAQSLVDFFIRGLPTLAGRGVVGGFPPLDTLVQYLPHLVLILLTVLAMQHSVLLLVAALVLGLLWQLRKMTDEKTWQKWQELPVAEDKKNRFFLSPELIGVLWDALPLSELHHTALADTVEACNKFLDLVYEIEEWKDPPPSPPIRWSLENQGGHSVPHVTAQSALLLRLYRNVMRCVHTFELGRFPDPRLQSLFAQFRDRMQQQLVRHLQECHARLQSRNEHRLLLTGEPFMPDNRRFTDDRAYLPL